MLTTLIKKDVLHLLRERKELMILIVMPFVLISILGMALGGLMGTGIEELDIPIALIDEGDEEQEWNRFVEELTEIPLPPHIQEQMLAQMSAFNPVDILLDDVLQGEELIDVITIETFPPGSEQEIKEDTKWTALLVIPENYRYELWKSTFFEEDTDVALQLHVNEGDSFRGNIIIDIIEGFGHSVNLHSAIMQSIVEGSDDYTAAQKQLELLAQSLDERAEGLMDMEARTDSIGERKPISSVEYYSIGMSVMFVLFVASYLADMAFSEKKIHVYNRLLIANVPSWKFLLSKYMTAVVISLFQLLFLYGMAAIVFKVYWPNLTSFLLITLFLSFAIGGMALLLITLNYRLNSQKISNAFANGITSLLAFIGGSFFPVALLSDAFITAGSWTPNGAALQAYLQALQGQPLASYSGLLVNLLVIGLVLFVVAVALFPKRGDAA